MIKLHAREKCNSNKTGKMENTFPSGEGHNLMVQPITMSSCYDQSDLDTLPH